MRMTRSIGENRTTAGRVFSSMHTPVFAVTLQKNAENPKHSTHIRLHCWIKPQRHKKALIHPQVQQTGQPVSAANVDSLLTEFTAEFVFNR
jgi:CRISPR/Cas system endoribonuclease Cas6 (RAMP superfamily)